MPVSRLEVIPCPIRTLPLGLPGVTPLRLRTTGVATAIYWWASFAPTCRGQVGKHYTSKVGKALPAMVFGMVADVGSVGKSRLSLLPLLRHLLRQGDPETKVSI